MTQFIPYTEGKVYEVEHLRQFDLTQARAGHPLAWMTNCAEIRYFAQCAETVFDISIFEKHDGYWINITRDLSELSNSIRLAPLAVKDGRALHVGDDIQIQKSKDNWVDVKCEFLFKDNYINFPKTWRFADEVTG